MKTFNEKLEEIGLADTRILSIVEASKKMHRAICDLDDYNLAIMKENFPELVSTATRFAENDTGSRRDFWEGGEEPTLAWLTTTIKF